MSLRAVLFDLDGTIVDTVPLILGAFREAASRVGIEFNQAFVRSKIGIPLEVQGELFAGARACEFIEAYREVYRKLHGADSRLFPGAAELLARLKSRGLRLALVTSKSLRSTTRVMEASGIADLFDAVVTCDDVAQPKPAAEPVLRALGTLGVDRTQAVYVGDAPSDLAASTAAGVPMIGVSWGAGRRDELAPGCAAVVDSWDELEAWVEDSWADSGAPV